MQKLVLLMAIAPFAVAVVVASETVSFTSVDSQASSGLVTYNVDLVGGYTLGAIDWEGFASTLQDYTYGSELRLGISGPLGSGEITLGSGSSYAPGSAFGGSSNLFSGVGDPAGTWTFDFYESYDDGADGLPDATWDYIDFLFGDWSLPEPPPATLVDVPSVTTGTSTSYEVEWFMFEIGSTFDMDINSFGTAYDTELGLYDDAGALLASNDDTGGLQSQILATLEAGTYYVALGGYNTAYNPLWDAVGGYASGDYTLTVTPEPGSLVLLALGLLVLRRR
jgi:hypothetical protein